MKRTVSVPRIQRSRKSRGNKTEWNKTEGSEPDPFLSEEGDGADKRTRLEEYFSQSLEVDLLLRLCPDDEDTIYQIVDLLVDTCSTKRKLLRVAGDDKPAEVVRSRFMKLNADHHHKHFSKWDITILRPERAGSRQGRQHPC